MKKLLNILFASGCLLLTSCSINKQITKQANTIIFSDTIFNPAHIGICIYEPSTNTYLYNYQSNKYFVPASNTKIFTTYAALKNLGDSLTGLQVIAEDGAYNARFVGDPTFLHADFKQQPIVEFIKQYTDKITFLKSNFTAQRFGNGWAWNDYDASYMAERSAAPIYGNVVGFNKKGKEIIVTPQSFKDSLTFLGNIQNGNFYISRLNNGNNFQLNNGNAKFNGEEIPFVTSETLTNQLLEDTLHKTIPFVNAEAINTNWKNIHSQPTDSLLKIMMHRSDNFFAEQTLLMVSNEKLGMMSDNKIIDTLLKTDFAGLPQKPKWVDGSGLSRYNLITPQDFVWVLTQMKNNFNWDRITTIFPTGNKGTLTGYYKKYAGKIYAKTGTLSNHVALSGYITTNKGKQLIFSFLVNHHQTSASNIRKSVEKFLGELIEKF